MELNMSQIVWLYLSCLFVQKISALNHTENFQIVVPEAPPQPEEEPSPSQNKTIDKLVQEQTEIIKKIVSDHREAIAEYPIVKEAKPKDTKTKEEKERQSIEELRLKCHHLFHPASDVESTEPPEEPEAEKTVEAFGPQQKPQFLQKLKPQAPTPVPEVLQTPQLPARFSSPAQVEQITQKQALNYFIMTRNRTSGQNNDEPQQMSDSSEPQNRIEAGLDLQKLPLQAQPSVFQPQTVQNPNIGNIRYVQLEPVILQRMILNNGRMLFYWYKSLPIPLAKYPPQPLNNYPYPQQAISNSETSHPSTTVQATNIQQKFLPQISQKYPAPVPNNPAQQSFQQNYIHTTEKVPHYEIEYGTTKKTDENLYHKQMKFVIPVPYPQRQGDEAPAATRHPWQFDPYAYYPKPLQPSTINVPLPYVPTFHMIRTLTIPEELLKAHNAGVAPTSKR